MSFFEWWGESSNPGPVGGVDVKGERIGAVWLTFTVVRFVVTVGLFAGAVLGATFFDGTPQLLRGLAAGGAFLLYLFAGYFVRPKPDTSNLGWAGGLVDNPFRISDDWNRNLMFLQVALFPGYLLARPVAEMFAVIAGEADTIE